MSLDLNVEIFTFGNLGMITTNLNEIINLDNLKKSYTLITKELLKKDKSWPWRFYKNFKIIMNFYENYLISNVKEFEKFENFFLFSIEFYEKILNIKDYDFIKPSTEEDFFGINTCILANLIKSKILLYKKNNSLLDVEKFQTKFGKYLIEEDFTYDYSAPYEDIKWTSKWKFLEKNREITFENVDVYLDNYFKNHNIFYNSSMCNNIESLEKRLDFLKNYSPEYFKILDKKLIKVTEKIFNTFPYSIVYNDYRRLLSYNCFLPNFLKIKETRKPSDLLWLFSIIPEFLSAYLLGFPVISMDIPNDKNILKNLDILEVRGAEDYFNYIRDRYNKKYIESISFGVGTGNLTEDDKLLDLCYEDIYEFNQDDVTCIFNDNVVHYFTSKEFNSLLKKQENPYNRKHFPNLTKIIENLKFKNKIKKNLLSRGIDVDLEGTLLSNLKEIQNKFSSKSIIHYFPYIENNTDAFYRPLLEILLQSL